MESTKFDEWLYSTRRRKKKTQAQVAEALGVKSQTISGWERGLVYPKLTFPQVIAFLQILEVKLEDIPSG